MTFVVFTAYFAVLVLLNGFGLPVLVFGMLGGYGAALALASWQRAGAVAKLDTWPTTTASIADCRAERDIVRGQSPAAADSLEWKPVVHYTYEVNNVSYQSNSFFSNVAGKHSLKQREIDRLMLELKRSKRAKIHYNPADPAEAFIAHPDNNNGLLCGAVLAAVCTLLVINGGPG